MKFRELSSFIYNTLFRTMNHLGFTIIFCSALIAVGRADEGICVQHGFDAAKFNAYNKAFDNVVVQV